jgi:hypothetical protein
VDVLQKRGHIAKDQQFRARGRAVGQISLCSARRCPSRLSSAMPLQACREPQRLSALNFWRTFRGSSSSRAGFWWCPNLAFRPVFRDQQ